MADLLFAAVAADDAQATRSIACQRVSKRSSSTRDDFTAFDTVDDFEVAASAATAADWTAYEDPFPTLPPQLRHPSQQFQELDLASDNASDDGTSVASTHNTELDNRLISLELNYPNHSTASTHITERLIQLTISVHTPRSVNRESQPMPIAEENINASLDEEERQLNVEVELKPDEALHIVGAVQCRVGNQVIVKAESLVRPLDSGSWLFTIDRTTIGRITDIFGCTDDPFYTISLTSQEAEIDLGTKLYTTERLSTFCDVSMPDEEEESEGESDEEMIREPVMTRSRRKLPPLQESRGRPRPRRSRERWHAMEEQQQQQWLPGFMAGCPFQTPTSFLSYSYPVAPVAYTPQVFSGFHPYNVLVLPSEMPQPPISQSHQVWQPWP